jgi:hypothetical protein
LTPSPQSSLDIPPVALHAAMHAEPSGPTLEPPAPQHTMPVGQSPPKHVTAFAAPHAAGSMHAVVGGRLVPLVTQHAWPVGQVVQVLPPPASEPLLLPLPLLLPVPLLLPLAPLLLPPLLLLLLLPPVLLGLFEPHAEASTVAIPTPNDAKKKPCELFMRRTVLSFGCMR